MIELQTVTTKAKNPSTNEFQDVTWGGINVISTSGTTNYNNLTNKPTINGVTVQGSLTAGDLLITAADVGALPSGTKYGADFALTIDSQTFVVTAQLKDQDGNNLGQAKTIDLPLETMVVGGRYDDTTQKIILTLKNGQTVEFSVADLVNGLQSEITPNNRLDADLIDDVSSRNKFVTSTEKSTWNGKQDAIADLLEIRSGAAAGATAVQQTAFETDQARQDALDAELAEEIETNKNNISSLQDMQTNYMKLVYRHFLGKSSGTASYRMTTTDFTAVDKTQQCGLYLITIINWSTTPTASIYIAYYSGGTPAYNALTKIGGADAQLNIDENRYINYTGNGKIQIYALQ